MQVANRLEEVQRQRNLTVEAMPGLDAAAANGAGALDVGSMQADAVMELPPANTRAGLYIFINSLVYTRSTISRAQATDPSSFSPVP
jgi:mediator of RNA polymerase II transcription subunit 5